MCVCICIYMCVYTHVYIMFILIHTRKKCFQFSILVEEPECQPKSAIMTFFFLFYSD